MEPVKEDLMIKGKQIYLRPITVQDTAMTVCWRNKESVLKNFIYRKPITCKEHANWLENKVFQGLVHQFIVCRNENGMPLGSVYLQHFDEESKRAEWGIFLGEEEVCGKGIGTEAAKLMLQYAFETLALHKVKARVLAYNKASIRLHEKAGYVQEAYFRDELFLDGRYEDLIFFAAINPNA